MKVLLLSNLFPPDYDGGYEISAAKAAEGLRARGHDVDVATSRFREGFAPTPEAPWVHRIFEFRPTLNLIASNGLRNKAEILRRLAFNEGRVKANLAALRRLVKDRDYDVAYVFGLHYVGLATTAALTERGIPLLWHFGDHYLADRLGYWEKSATYRLAARTFLRPVYEGEANLDLAHTAFISRYLLDYYRERGVPLASTSILPRGIEFPPETDLDRPREAPPTILMAGRVAASKGFHLALRAALALRDRRPDLDWRLQIVGTGEEDYLAELREVARPLGDRVAFLGKRPREEVLERFRQASLFVSASVWGEPFGRTIIEAMGMGTPIVGSDAGAMLEIVTPGESALIYPKDDADALSRELERALDDPDLRRRLAERGLARVAEAYTMERILDRTEALLADVASSRRHRAD